MPAIHIPTTAAGLLIAAWLNAFNAGSEALLREFHTRAFPRPSNDLDEDDNAHDNVANELAFRARTGGFDVLEILTSEEYKVELLLKWRSAEKKHKVMMKADPGRLGVVNKFLMETVEGDGVSGERVEGL
jgi:hypothetical protein